MVPPQVGWLSTPAVITRSARPPHDPTWTPRARGAETAFTSVRSTHRGAGVATAVKAASVLALAADGVRVFGTGGAGSNAASLGMNQAVGYRVTERWLTLDP